MNTENRRHARKPINVSVIIKEDKGQPHNAISADLSMQGICLFTGKEDIQSGQIYNLKFNILIRGKYMDVNAQAKVVHKAVHKYHGYTVGLEFTTIDSLSCATLESFVGAFR